MCRIIWNHDQRTGTLVNHLLRHLFFISFIVDFDINAIALPGVVFCWVCSLFCFLFSALNLALFDQNTFKRRVYPKKGNELVITVYHFNVLKLETITTYVLQFGQVHWNEIHWRRQFVSLWTGYYSLLYIHIHLLTSFELLLFTDVNTMKPFIFLGVTCSCFFPK